MEDVLFKRAETIEEVKENIYRIICGWDKITYSIQSFSLSYIVSNLKSLGMVELEEAFPNELKVTLKY
ncbi:MAG: hypothetical protein RR537_04825 [Longicatena sp.]